MIKVIRLLKSQKGRIEEATKLLYRGTKIIAPKAWRTMRSARAEILDCLEEGHISLAAINNEGRMIGWVGARPQYGKVTWELHPLVVAEKNRRHGVGRELLCVIEKAVYARGGRTLYLGTDDEVGLTSLAGKNLYPRLFTEIKNIKNISRHPFEFYYKCGYTIVGVIPDANGYGKPDIIMAKRITKKTSKK